MKTAPYRLRLQKILNHCPEVKDILMSTEPVHRKRRRLRYVLADLLAATFADNPKIPPLEWILARDAINVFRNILSTRNERLADFSFLQFLNDLLHEDYIPKSLTLSQGFFSELEHLFRSIVGKTDIYSEKVPAFLKHEGQKSAKLRSMDLSRMSKESEKFLKRYTCGLDEAVMERRKENAERILKYFGRSGDDWNDWKWHTRNIIRSAETLKDLVELSAEDFKAVRKANEHRIPFGITPYYLSLMDLRRGGGKDDAVRAQVIPPMDYVEKMVAAKGQRECSMDFMMEKDTSPLEGVTRRYPGIVILKPILTCPQICVYCQRNWEIEDVFTSTTAVSQKTIDRAVDWIGERPEISEVLITGGDPLLLSNDRLFGLLEKLSGLPGVERVRIGTRMPVTLPQRVTDDLVQALATFHRPGKRELILVTHFEHSYEITPESLAAVQKFRRCGMDVYNQLVYTFYNSRRFEAVALRQKLRLIGVTPYYTFNTKGKEETQRYRVPIARLLQEQHEEARLMPGTVRTDEIVFNVPRLGKNYLRASQHHDVISILPTGQRVFEFHPWEKKLSLVDTYVYTDVSIHDYLQRLKTVGEKRSDYQTIWYYY